MLAKLLGPAPPGGGGLALLCLGPFPAYQLGLSQAKGGVDTLNTFLNTGEADWDEPRENMRDFSGVAPYFPEVPSI